MILFKIWGNFYSQKYNKYYSLFVKFIITYYLFSYIFIIEKYHLKTKYKEIKESKIKIKI
jgi:hypothetical protein